MTPRTATFGVFAINGAMIGTWVAHIPWLQDHLDVSKTTVGLCLLCMAAGALVAMPLTGQLLDGRSSAIVTRIAALVFCLMLPLPLLASGPVALGAILFVFGAANGAMDVSMNAHGVAVERGLSRPIMSSLHGGWSLGGFAAAGLAAATGTAGLDPRLESVIVGIGLWLVALWITARLGNASAHTPSAEGRGFAWPARPVMLIGLLCFLVMMIEGAIGDWSGIYLQEDLGAGAAAAATGFAGFSLGMAVARLAGDRLNERLGAGRLLRGGMALVALALGAALADRSADPGGGRVRAGGARHRQRRPPPVQRRRPGAAGRSVAGCGLHRGVHGLHRGTARDRLPGGLDRLAADTRPSVHLRPLGRGVRRPSRPRGRRARPAAADGAILSD